MSDTHLTSHTDASHATMCWQELLNAARLGQRPSKDETGRTAFLSDHDKIIFSGAFRRLARKTQVHPLATNDHVHNRLTHSLEVSCVGRTLGIRVGEKLQQAQRLPAQTAATDLGDIVQSACLAHDIGNPPFGHTGERAIRAWFADQGLTFIAGLPEHQQRDFTCFEGNAQGFRILTRSEYHLHDDGMRLTYATLGTFLKYPWLSTQAKRGKYSIFAADRPKFDEVVAACGLLPKGEGRYARHPLAYLMEAADDFCYALIDLEDGLEMDLLRWEEVFELLQPVLAADNGAQQLPDLSVREGRRAALLRGKIIGRFIESGVDAFMAQHDKLLQGELNGDLISHGSADVRQVVGDAKDLARRKIFENPRKVELEIGAYEVISILLSSLVKAATAYAHGEQTNHRHQRIIDLIGRHSFPPGLEKMEPTERLYQCLLTATGFLAGMTDNYATYLAKQFSGMAEIRY